MFISNDKLVFPCGMSRSGTTLLATILDSHSYISMCYELIPPDFQSLKKLQSLLWVGLALTNNDFSTCGQALRNKGYKQEGLFFTRCYRSGVDDKDVELLLRDMQDQGIESINSLEQRLRVAWMISNRSSLKRNKSYYGFKLNIPSVSRAFDFFPKGKLVYILRDPRDVVASHLQRKFDRTIPEVCKAWMNYIESFEIFRSKNPSAGMIVRYEDVVSDSLKTLSEIFMFLSLDMEASVTKFYQSKAGVHIYGHPNSENLKKNFFTTSIGRWQYELDLNTVQSIEKICGSSMVIHGYSLVC